MFNNKNWSIFKRSSNLPFQDVFHVEETYEFFEQVILLSSEKVILM